MLKLIKKIQTIRIEFLELPFFAALLMLYVGAQLSVRGKSDVNWNPRQSAHAAQVEEIYLASPLEEEILASEKIWPRHFNERNVLNDEELPQLYHLTEDAAEGWNPTLMSQAREWSVLMASAHFEPLRRALAAPPLTRRADLQTCDPLARERLFRELQLQRAAGSTLAPAYDAGLKSLSHCAASSPVLLFLRFHLELERKKLDKAEALIAELQKLAAHGRRQEWATYFALRISRSAELMLAEARGLGKKPQSEL